MSILNSGLYAKKSTGFTLVELMIVIVIISILMTIAVPAYTSQIRKSRRTEARTAVLDLAAREERFYSTGNTYSDKQTDLGYATSGTATLAAPGGITLNSGYYNLQVAFVPAAPSATPPTPPTYTITATAIGAQANDTDCQSFSVNQIGQQTATNSGGATSATINSACWGN